MELSDASKVRDRIKFDFSVWDCRNLYFQAGSLSA